MAKETSGYVFKDKKDGKWIARITYTDSTGKRRNVKRKAENKTAAKELQKQLVRQFDDHGKKIFSAEKMHFRDLADYFTTHYMKPAEYKENRKIAGMRSYNIAISHFKPVREFFDHKMLKAITYETISQYRSQRLNSKTVRGNTRSIATVNRELALLRRVFNIAQRQGWILRNPFVTGDTLISIADEKKRERIITKLEETKLLEACVGVRTHLKPIIVCALDTGMRQGEILKLKWTDIDFVNRVITVQAFNTKTMKERQVYMTSRLEKELKKLYSNITDPTVLVFGIKNNVKKSFDSVRKIAGLEDVRFHDLRHTAATRLVTKHLPLSEVGRILGHTQANTTYRYVNANIETAKRAATLLEEFNEDTTEIKIDASELVN
jgi:integrase